MIVLTIRLTEVETGVLYECVPSQESTKDYTMAEVEVAKIIMHGCHETVMRATKEIGCPITQMTQDPKGGQV